jgi:hypothetical protein
VSTTIQIGEERKARLNRLKVGSLTYDDVIVQLLNDVDEESFRRRALAWQEELARKIRSNRENRPVL